MKLGICILTWNKPITLNNTLRSYEKYQLLNNVDEKLILLQENNPEEREIAKKFNLKIISTDKNIGIGKGMKMLIENMESEYIIFLENDWELTSDQINREIFQKIKYFENGDLDYYKLRSRRNPGTPLWSLWLRKFNKENWPDREKDNVLSCVHWIKDPEKIWSEDITKVEDFYLCYSSRGSYTNNPFLCKRKWFTENLFPIMENSEGRENEVDMRSWWRQQKFKMGQGEGLFTHKDLRK